MDKVMTTALCLVPQSKECSPYFQHAVGGCGFTGKLPAGSVCGCVNVKQSIDENVVNILKACFPG